MVTLHKVQVIQKIDAAVYQDTIQQYLDQGYYIQDTHVFNGWPRPEEHLNGQVYVAIMVKITSTE